MAGTTYSLDISFNANHGSGAPSGVTFYSEWYNNAITFTGTLPSGRPSRTYYTFLGWSASSTASSATWSAGGSFSKTYTGAGDDHAITLYAVWRRATAYVYYNANGGTGAPATQSHNAGTNVTLSATVPTRSGYRFLGWATSASATSAPYQPSTSQAFYTTVTLYAVWKIMVSTITASNGTMGAAQTITITKQDSAYKDTVTYSFGSQSGTIASESTATSISWTPPLSLASEIPNAKSATCTLTTQTYNGTTLIGSSSKTITLSVPNTMTPSATVTLADTNAVASGMGVYVQSRSALEVTVSASGQYGATITGYSTQINSNAYSEATFTTGALIASGTNSYTTVVTDSRGMQTTVTGTFTVVSYTAPTAQVPSITRDETTSSNINVALEYIVASVNNLNAKTYTVEYKLRSASTYQTYSSGTLPDYNGTLNLVLTGFSGDNDYDFIFTVADSFSAEFGAGTFETSIGSDNSLLIHSQHKAGLGFGMPSQGERRNDYRYPVYMRQGSAVYSLSGSGYVKAFTMEASDSNITAPITLEYIRTGDTQPSQITLKFDSSFALDTFVSTITATAYMALSGSVWSLYIDSSGEVDILDMHNPWTNSGLSIAWDGTTVSALPTGATQASLIPTNLVTAYGDLSYTGQTVSNSPSEISLTASTYKSVAQFTLPKGKWIISGCVRWGMSSTGRRWCALSTAQDSSGSTVAVLTTDEIKGWSDGSGHAFTRFCSAISVSASTVYYLNAWQNSGSALACLGRLMAIRIC